MEQKTSLSRAELKQLRNSPTGVIVIDVRRPEEYNAQRIPFAVNIPVEEIETGNVNLDFSKPVVTVCGKGGGRSEKAAQLLREKFNSNVYFLEGGTFGWNENENQK